MHEDIATSATLLITHEPAGPSECAALCDGVLRKLGLEHIADYLTVEYFISDRCPPGLPLWEQDQIEAAHRDAPGSKFFTVLIESPEDDDEWSEVEDDDRII